MPSLSGRPLLSTSIDRHLVIDRSAEVDLQCDAVSRGLNVLVCGDRGSGLTTMLHQVMRRLQRENVAHPRFVNAAAVTDSDDFVQQVAGDVVPTVSVVGSVAPYSKFARFRELPDGVLGCIDNASPRLIREVFGAYRDEVWALPMTWLVTCPERDRAAVLEPPVDTFFDVVLELAPLTDVEAARLLRRRTTKDELSAAALRAAVSAGRGNPRALIQAARAIVLGQRQPSELAAAGFDRDRLRDRLSGPARVLLDELIARGPASASDAALREATGWSRARLVQVFGELERSGAVESAQSNDGRSGRPRKIYRAR